MYKTHYFSNKFS